MNNIDLLKIVKLANKLMKDYPKTKTPIQLLQWIKQANELLKLQQAQTEPLPDNQYIKRLQDIVGGKLDSKSITELYGELSACIYELDDMELLEGSVARLAHDAIGHWAKEERTHAI